MSDEPKTPRYSEKRPPMDRWGSRTFLFLFHDFWFRMFLIGIIVVAAVTGLFLPKVLIRTPPDFLPPLKASGLDLIQAWNLKRQAARHHAAGEIDDAVDAWSLAELNDPGDEQIPRGALRTLLLETKPNRERLFYGYERSIHLLRLTHTNNADLELVARYFLAKGIHQYLGRFIPPNLTQLGQETAAALLATAFDRRDMTAFERLWTAHSAQLSNDPPSRLRHAAWAMEWGPAVGAAAGRRELQEAREDVQRRDLANQLLLAVHFHREDSAAYQATLAELVERHVDRPRDHIGLWRLLHRLGRADEAVTLAKRHSAPATDPSEAIDYATALTQLGLADASAEYLHREIPNFAFDMTLWRLQAQNYMKLKRWDELRNLAVLMRNSIPLHGTLEGFSGFLEGYADAATDRPESAQILFTRAAGESFGNNDLAFECAVAMRSVGQAGPALTLFNTLTNRAGNDPGFWFNYTLTAGAARESAATLIGAEKTYAIDPTAAGHLHNYVTALVVNRTQPAKALELSIRRLQQNPEDRRAIINHVLALLLNGYTGEVESQLNSISTFELSADETADLQLAWFEYYLLTKQYPLARMAFNRLETRRLFPNQAEWVRENVLKLPENP